MKFTLNDVPCVLDLHIEGCLLDHDGLASIPEKVQLMVVLLRDDLEDVEVQVAATNDAHARFNFLRKEFLSRLQVTFAVEVEEDDGEMQLNQEQTVSEQNVFNIAL